jgi:hypothetical protein
VLRLSPIGERDNSFWTFGGRFEKSAFELVIEIIRKAKEIDKI